VGLQAKRPSWNNVTLCQKHESNAKKMDMGIDHLEWEAGGAQPQMLALHTLCIVAVRLTSLGLPQLTAQPNRPRHLYVHHFLQASRVPGAPDVFMGIEIPRYPDLGAKRTGQGGPGAKS
jgi:hypothetical protein